jgi:hypothetical protein
VPHPRLLGVQRGRLSGFGAGVGRVASTALGSMALFWTAFLVPLLALPASDGVKLVVSVVFSSWFQAWALPVLQHAANRAELQHAAKADADHLALTSLHHKVDQLLRVYAMRPKGDRSG